MWCKSFANSISFILLVLPPSTKAPLSIRVYTLSLKCHYRECLPSIESSKMANRPHLCLEELKKDKEIRYSLSYRMYPFKAPQKGCERWLCCSLPALCTYLFCLGLIGFCRLMGELLSWELDPVASRDPFRAHHPKTYAAFQSLKTSFLAPLNSVTFGSHVLPLNHILTCGEALITSNNKTLLRELNLASDVCWLKRVKLS